MTPHAQPPAHGSADPAGEPSAGPLILESWDTGQSAVTRSNPGFFARGSETVVYSDGSVRVADPGLGDNVFGGGAAGKRRGGGRWRRRGRQFQFAGLAGNTACRTVTAINARGRGWIFQLRSSFLARTGRDPPPHRSFHPAPGGHLDGHHHLHGLHHPLRRGGLFHRLPHDGGRQPGA